MDSQHSCCGEGYIGGKGGCCKVESVISVDERGQMVLPKELRGKVGIKPGDKLAVFSWKKGEEVCCLGLIKAERISRMLREMLGPLAGEIKK